ncbi:hypothetical protein DNHGIG_35330 [Collibacillus ludicampi]|jgi:hypothetical protein|uniref:Uncharacterized protein n=1 Tax=Collibacillus ludicampi TaxID=2771369 RepID=A0AAV4LJH9_9BACL|nr:hypothetical protein [Collibacillus ludicampi]GIM47984.1 hypothetical protein DNHGIG_35330 [Collibacillus ludicampi]
MLPALLIKIALIIIMVRCIYVAFKCKHSILDMLFYVSVVIVAFAYYLEHFHSFLGIYP